MRHWDILRPRQNGHPFADDVFKCIFAVNENVWIFIKISLKFVPKGSINNIPALVQVMTWCRSDDKPLSEPMMIRLPTHSSICATRPQWDNGDSYTGKTTPFYGISTLVIWVAFSVCMSVMYNAPERDRNPPDALLASGRYRCASGMLWRACRVAA